jgi:hypothetical protein
MRREDLLPPAVKDLCEKLRDPRESDFAKDNVLARLVAIEQEVRISIKRYKRERIQK